MIQDWINYTDRSYQQIKASLLSRLVISNPEVTDHSESNLLVVIIGMFSGVAEKLHYYIDNAARESFIGTARRFVSMVKLVRILDYRIKARYPSVADIQISFFDSGSTPVALSSPGLIPALSTVETLSGVTYRVLSNIVIPAGSLVYSFSAEQVDLITGQNIGTTTGLANQQVTIGTTYVDGTMEIDINGDPWVLQETLGYSTPTDKHFIVEIDVDGLAKVVFGDGVNAEIPQPGYTILASYRTTLGVLGKTNANTITTVGSFTGSSFPGATSYTINNPLASVGGSDYQGIESIRNLAPRSIRTLSRAVTRQDYIDIALLAPGVAKAALEYYCGKNIYIYIAPNGGGIAQSALLATTLAYFDDKKMVTTFPRIRPAGESYLVIVLTVTKKNRADATLTELDIRGAVENFYSFDNSDINKVIALSDLYSVVDNLSRVERLTIDFIGLRPYARPQNHNHELNWDKVTLLSSTTVNVWKLVYTGIGVFSLYRNQSFLANIPINTVYTDPLNTITIELYTGAYSISNEWVFKTYPANRDILIDDFTVPTLINTDLTLNIQ
jgi:hypothetical protein